MKVAIAYFGLTRSLRYVYKNHEEMIYKTLKENNIEYDIFIHTWKIEQNEVWDKIINVPIDENEYMLLNSSYSKKDVQTDFLENLQFDLYHNKEEWDKYGDNPAHEWIPKLILNHICMLESQRRVSDMILDSNVVYDRVIFIRPDAIFLDNLDCTSMLEQTPDTVIIPNHNHHEGLNALFAILHYSTFQYYGKRIEDAATYRKTIGRLVSEKFMKYTLEKYYSRILQITLPFNLMRPDGSLFL